MNNLFHKELWTKELIAWYLYDFANSLIFINIILYFSQWVIVDKGLTDFWYSLPLVFSTLLLIFISTNVGMEGDRKGTHARTFRLYTTIAFISVIGMILFGKVVEGLPGAIIALLFFGIYQFAYQLALVPYNAFIKHITIEKNYGKVSGIGFAMNELGHIAGLLLTLPITTGTVTLLGNDRLSSILPAVIVFIAFVLPAIIIFGRKKLPTTRTHQQPFWKAFWHNLKETKKYPGVFNLLISFYLFSDAILTITIYSAIYLQKVFELSDALKVSIYLYVLAGFTLGSLLGGIISDIFKHKRVLIFSLLTNATVTILIALATERIALIPLFILFGISMGTAYSSSRSHLLMLVPKKKSGTFFGLYTFAERIASIVGPTIWALTVFVLSNHFPTNYRVAVIMMGILVFLGILPLLNISPITKKIPKYS